MDEALKRTEEGSRPVVLDGVGDGDGGEERCEQPALAECERQALEWRRVSLTLERPGAGGPLRILISLSGGAYPGQMHAVLGSTGSGKSSLLNVLAQRLKRARGLRLEGEVTINGAPRAQDWKCAYVQQDDLLFGELTVLETLVFAASLRLPEGTSAAARDARVDEVVRSLGLGGALQTRVGGELSRGISGGERKRLSLGIELITPASILLLDEPSSGLDAFNAMNVMSSLKALCSSGRTVVVTIHQPRSGIMRQFDAIQLLSQGKLIFSGLAADALRFFESTGLPLPAHTNPGDWFVDCISLDTSSCQAKAASQARIDMLAAAYADRRDACLAAQLRAAGADGARGKAAGAAMAGAGRRPATLRRWWTELRALSLRAYRLSKRQSFFNAVSAGRTALFALFLGLIWLRLGSNPDGQQGRIRGVAGLLFISLVNHAFGGVFGVVFTFSSECALVFRERTAGAYRLSPYFVSKVGLSMPRVALLTLIHCLLLYWLAALRPSAAAFFSFYAVHVLVLLNVEAATMAAAAASKTEKSAAAFAPIPLVFGLLFAGFFVGSSQIPVWLSWIRYLVPLHYAFIALVKIEYQRRDFDCLDASLSCVPNGEAAMRLLGVSGGDVLDVAGNCWVLVALLVASWGATYAILRISNPRYDTSL